MRVAVIGGGLGSLLLASRLAEAGWETHWFRAEAPDTLESPPHPLGFTFDPRPVPFTDAAALTGLFTKLPAAIARGLEMLPVRPGYRLVWRDASIEVDQGLVRGAGAGSEIAARLGAARGRGSGTAAAHLLRFPDALAAAARVEGEGTALQVMQARVFDAVLWGRDPERSASTAPLARAPLFYPRGGLAGVRGALTRLFRHHSGVLRDAAQLAGSEPHPRGGTGLRVGARLEQFDHVLSHADRAVLTPPHRRRASASAWPRYADPNDWTTCVVLNLGLARAPGDLPHHTVFFEPSLRGVGGAPLGIYVRHPTRTDPSLAPRGGAVVSAICPLPRTTARSLDWEREGAIWRRALLDFLRRALGISTRDVVIVELSTPKDHCRALDGARVSLLPPSRARSGLLEAAQRRAGAAP